LFDASDNDKSGQTKTIIYFPLCVWRGCDLIKLWMINAQIDTTKLNSAMRRYVSELGFAAGEVVRNQTRLLMRDIFNHAPPTSKSKANQRINRDINAKMTTLPQSLRGKKSGPKRNWLNVSPWDLIGVDPQNDYRRSSDVYKPFRNRDFARSKFPVAGRRGKQKIRLVNRMLVTKAAKSQLSKRLMNRVGRIKASFLVGWYSISKGGWSPPAWVSRQIYKGVGHFADITHSKDKPSFTIIANATGVESDRVVGIVRKAVNFRYHSMIKDVQLYMKGIKKKAGFSRA
jgi:hypothetical protein